VVHGAGVHVGRLLLLLQHLQLLGGEGEGEEAEDDGVEEGDDGESEGPANTTRSQLVIISLGSTHSSHLVIVPASGEAEETNEETEAGEKLESAADSEHVRGPAHEEEDEGDDADDADDDSDANKHCGCSEGGRQDCSEIIQSTSTYLSSILAVHTPSPDSKVSRPLGVLCIPNPLILKKDNNDEDSVADSEDSPQHTHCLRVSHKLGRVVVTLFMIIDFTLHCYSQIITNYE